ncbi:MAG TPA: adenylate kinase [Clostridiales bacterium]|nr:adenylate kinase [Clostridiales bacterium]
MKLLLMGPVGSGKGTQAALISEKYNIPHISTGEIFRWNIKNNTQLGQLVKPYIEKGELVPEDITFEMVEDRLSKDDCRNGFILDGYPRNIQQAHALDTITTLDKVIMINISEDIIIARLSNRRMCSQCNQPTRVEWLVDGKCEKCGGEVYQRDDDKPEIIKNRLEKQDISKEMIEFYENKGIFYSIESTNVVEKTFALIDEVIKK